MSIRDVTPRSARYYAAKRAVDIALAAVIGLLVAPVVPVIAVAIKLDSPGPVIFRQERLRGRGVKVHGQWRWEIAPFTFYKFRTMTADAPKQTTHQEYMKAYITGDTDRMSSINGAGSKSYKLSNDRRVTRVGRVLRKASLDELPQLWNVLTGDMSIVGPRPPLPYEVELYQERHFVRMASPPGLTGWWQVKGRCETKFEEMVELDLEYIANRSIWMDLKIVLLTLPAVLTGRGAG